MTNFITRFWANVARKSQDDCWLWKGATGYGYGRVRIGGRLYSSHRVAYVLGHEVKAEDLPKRASYHGVVVRHTCDNRLCCNPRHLVLGTQKDNVHDAMERGRHYIPNKGGGR